MDDRAYEQLRQSMEDRYRERMREAEREYSRHLEALEIMRDLAAQAQQVRVTDLASHIEQIMPELSKTPFTTKEVAARLRIEFPRLNGLIKDRSVADAIKNLARGEKIRVIEEGAGRRPAMYESVGSTAMAM